MPVTTPRSLADALQALAEHPEATVLAGGTDVMVEVNFGHRLLDHVISVSRVAELRQWSTDGTTVRIGAAVPYHEMERGELANLLPALAQAARTVGSPQIRAAGTLGGNLGTASPAGDGLPVLLALDATVHLANATGARAVPVGEFLVGVKRTALRPGELVTAIEIPLLDGWQGYAKVGTRNAMVIAVAAACLAVDRANANVRLALGSVAPTAVRCPDAETWLAAEHDVAGSEPLPQAIGVEFGRRASLECSPIDDHRSTAAYRRHAVSVLAARLAARAFGGTT
jgi:CO/xanthine dehydrogenase FAD-binding subunit